MNTGQLAALIAAVFFAAGVCVAAYALIKLARLLTEATRTLTDAREQYMQTKDGVAMQLDPTDVHEADVALQRAEQAWRDSPDDPSTVDLAVVADRKAQIAQATAATIKAQQDAQMAKQEGATLTASALTNARGQLGQTQAQLGQ